MNEVQNYNGPGLVNPFEQPSSMPAHVNAGTVMIEQERAIAEVKGKLTSAKMFPRDEAMAFQQVMNACSRPSLAKVAEYRFKRGGQEVNGPTIRLAEVIAAAWGNIDYGIRELSRGEGYSEMEAYAWDMQTNTISAQRFTVRHIRDRSDANGGNVSLTQERDIYERTANDASRRVRERIFAVVPPDLVEMAVKKCRDTMAGNSDRPIADRVRDMISAFNKYSVTAQMIETRLGRKLDSILPDDFADLMAVYNSIKDGAKVSDFFGGEAVALAAPASSDGQAQQQGAKTAPKSTRKKDAAPKQEEAKPQEQKQADAAPASTQDDAQQEQQEQQEQREAAPTLAQPATQPQPETTQAAPAASAADVF